MRTSRRIVKSRTVHPVSTLPKEVLNPLEAQQHFTACTRSPGAALQDHVENFWILRWDLRGRAPYVSDVLPSPNVNLTFMPEGPRITGVTTGRYAYDLRGAGAIFGVTFLPGAFRPLLGRSTVELTNQAVPATAVFPSLDAQFNAAVVSQLNDDAMTSLVQAHLTPLLAARADPKVALVQRVIECVRQHPGLAVKDVARRMDMSERALQGLFRGYVGVGLKWVLARARLQRAAHMAISQARPDWAAVAQELGYVDQAHFIKDFKKVIGTTPHRYAAMAAQQAQVQL